MTWFAVRAGQPLERGLTIAYGVMALGSLVMSIWFLRARAVADRAVRAPRRLAARRSFSRHHRRGVAGTGPAPDAGARGGDPAGHAARQPARQDPLPPRAVRLEGGGTPGAPGAGSAFIAGVTSGKGQLFLGRAPDEIVVGTVGKLHQIRDQEFAEVPTTADFAAFAAEPRAARDEHPGDSRRPRDVARPRAPDTADRCTARRRFARYWLAIRPGGRLSRGNC